MGCAVACMSIRLHTSKTHCHTQPAMRAKGPRIGPHCHSAIRTTARGWAAHFFYDNWTFFFFFLHQQWFWRIWSLPLNLLNVSKQSPTCQRVGTVLFGGAFLVSQLLGTSHRWHCWLTLRLCCQRCKRRRWEESTLETHQLWIWEKRKKITFIYAQVPFAKYNLVTSN